MRTNIVWIAPATTLILSRSMLPASAPQSHGPENKITILAYDFAHIGPKTLTKAERVASDIFLAAGIDAEWIAGPISDRSALISDFSAVPENRCAGPLPSGLIRVQIHSHAPAGFATLALGYALPCAQRGMQVTLYSDRVEAVSGSTLATFYRVLGHALAHEAGHVLLRSTSHESSGLMKGVWTKSDWQRAAVTIIPFTPEQARRMAEGLAHSPFAAGFVLRREPHEAVSYRLR